MNPPAQTIAEIRRERIKWGITQRALALASGITPRYLNSLERGQRPNTGYGVIVRLQESLERLKLQIGTPPIQAKKKKKL
jgi:transcriptional regulator with XRE-family HTH domain